MTDNGAHSFTEGSEPIKLTDEQRIEKQARLYCDGSSEYLFEYRGYIAGATAEHKLLKPQLAYADNYIQMVTESRDKLVQQLKEERNKAIDDIINYLGSDINDNDHVERYWPKLKSELEEFKSLKSDSK